MTHTQSVSDEAVEAASTSESKPLWAQHEMLSVVAINFRIALRDNLEFREAPDPKQLENLLIEVDRALATECNTSYARGFSDGRDEAAAPFEDKARLDFLDEMNRRLNARYGTHYRWKLILNHNVNRLMLNDMAVDLQDAEANGLPSCRDAIDAERSRILESRAAALAAQAKSNPDEDGPEITFTPAHLKEMQRVADQARRTTLEEAAKKLEAHAADVERAGDQHDQGGDIYSNARGVKQSAEIIRALAAQDAPGKE